MSHLLWHALQFPSSRDQWLFAGRTHEPDRQERKSMQNQQCSKLQALNVSAYLMLWRILSHLNSKQNYMLHRSITKVFQFILHLWKHHAEFGLGNHFGSMTYVKLFASWPKAFGILPDKNAQICLCVLGDLILKQKISFAPFPKSE